MPRYEEPTEPTYVTFTIQVTNSGAAEKWRVENGMTLNEVFDEEYPLNTAKHTIIVNGNPVTDLDTRVHQDDEIVCLPKKYSSGVKAI